MLASRICFKSDCLSFNHNHMQKDLIYRWGIFPLWLFLASSMLFRSPIPVDETRYLSVAWEMWLRGDFWVPFLNGQTYSHKPPLLFWLFQAGWAVFGVNEWWPRLVGPLCALTNLFLIRKLAEKLWPEETGIALLAPWILIATLLWTLFATSGMFDILLTCDVLLGMLGLLSLAQGIELKGVAYVAIAIGFGLLTKGPVIFLHLLPTAFLVSLWSSNRNSKFFGNLGVAVLAGVLIGLAWAIPAAKHGGAEYANAIFWQQTANRTVGSEIHVRPFIWYSLFLPLILFPWIVWPCFWKNLLHIKIADDCSLRFCLVWLVSSFLIFSILPSKQIHYLIPMLPAFALVATRALYKAGQTVSLASELLVPSAFGMIGLFLIFLPHVPGLTNFKWVQAVECGWGLGVLAVAALMLIAVLYARKLSVAVVSIALVSAVFIGFVFFFQYTGLAYNLRPAALQLKSLNEKGVSCAYVGTYHGQLQFLGRLPQPLQTLSADQVADWVKLHADGYLISVEKQKPLEAVYLQPHREYWLVFRRADQASRIKPL